MIAKARQTTTALNEAQSDPTPEEIRGCAAKSVRLAARSGSGPRSCYRSPPVTVPTVRISGINRDELNADE